MSNETSNPNCTSGTSPPNSVTRKNKESPVLSKRKMAQTAKMRTYDWLMANDNKNRLNYETSDLALPIEESKNTAQTLLFENLPELITLKEAAEVTRISQRTLESLRYKKDQRTKGMFTKPFGRVMVITSELRKYVLHSKEN